MPTASPPLSTLRIFDAAGRRMSFRDAATELNVTPSAVSHSVRSLETYLGVNLFQRANRGLSFTDEGRKYYAQMQEVFLKIRQATQEVSRHANKRSLSVHSVPSLASLWLMPRIPSFVAKHPDIDLTISASPEPANFVNDYVDIDIRYGASTAKGLHAEPLLTESLVPLCNPSLLSGKVPITDPASLRNATLIELNSGAVDWNQWFALNDLGPLETRPRLRFDRSIMSIQAAAQGLGVILESTTLAADAIAAGQLVNPFGKRARAIELVGHFLVYSKSRSNTRLVQQFAHWVKACAEPPCNSMTDTIGGREVSPQG